MSATYPKTLLAVFFFTQLRPAIGQYSTSKFDWGELIYSENHFSFIFLYGRTPKAIIDPDPNIYQIGTNDYECLEGGIDYHYSINRNYSLVTGFRWAGIMRDLEYFVPRTEFSPPLSYDLDSDRRFDKHGVVLFRVPFLVERRFWTGQKGAWNIQAGIGLCFSLLNEEETGGNGFFVNGSPVVSYIYGLFTPNNNQKPWLNYHLAGGYQWLLENRDLLSINLVTELSGTHFFRGYYSFDIPGKPQVRFNYGVKGSYLAVSARYTRTKAKKKFLKLRLQ